MKIKPRLANGRYFLWEDASKAVQRLGIKSGPEYRRRYKEDPKLPSSVMKTYLKDWKPKGKWYGFLGKVPKYKFWAEAAPAARKLGITSPGEYSRLRHKDPRLPVDPRKAYKGDWYLHDTWTGFLGLMEIEKPDDEWEIWEEE